MTEHYPHEPNPSQQWGGQPPQGGPYPPVPPGPAPKKRSWFARHKILTGLLALVALIVVISVGSQAGKSSSDAAASDSATAQGAAAQPTTGQDTTEQGSAGQPSKKAEATTKKGDTGKPGVGTAVKSGDLQFTVTKVVRDQRSVGKDFLAQKAQGSFTLVYVTVRNVGKESQTLLDSDQKIKDADSKTYSPDTTAQIALDTSNNLFLEQINPGNAVDGVLVYDMPSGVQATAIEFSGGLFEDAKTVQLR